MSAFDEEDTRGPRKPQNWVVVHKMVAVRAKPDVKSRLVGTKKQGETLIVKAQSQGWVNEAELHEGLGHGPRARRAGPGAEDRRRGRKSQELRDEGPERPPHQHRHRPPIQGRGTIKRQRRRVSGLLPKRIARLNAARSWRCAPLPGEAREHPWMPLLRSLRDDHEEPVEVRPRRVEQGAGARRRRRRHVTAAGLRAVPASNLRLDVVFE